VFNNITDVMGVSLNRFLCSHRSKIE